MTSRSRKQQTASGGRGLPRGVSVTKNLPTTPTKESRRPPRLAIVGKRGQIDVKEMVSVMICPAARLVLRPALAHTLETQNPSMRPGPRRRRYQTSPSHPKPAPTRPLRKNRHPFGHRHANPGVLLLDEAELDATNTQKTGTSMAPEPSHQGEGNHTRSAETPREWDTVVSTAHTSMAGTPDARANLGTCTHSGQR